MALTQQQLQQALNQLSGDLAKFNTIVNGDALTTVTLSNNVVLPSIAKMINDTVQSVSQSYISTLRTTFSALVQDLLSNLYPTNVFSITIQQNQLGQLIQVNLTNLVAVNKVEINGLEQDPTGNAYNVSGTTVSIPANTGLQLNDVVDIYYYYTS